MSNKVSVHRSAYLMTQHMRDFCAVGMPGLVRCYGYDAVEYAVKMRWIIMDRDAQFGEVPAMGNFEVTYDGCAMLERVEERIGRSFLARFSA